MKLLHAILSGTLLTMSLGAQQWLRPWCTGNGPADLYANAGTAPTFGTADIDLSVGFCASPTNPATVTGIRMRVDYECGPMTWSHGGFFKLFVEFNVVDAGACTPYRALAVRVYGWNTFFCNYLTVRNARARINGSSMDFPPVAGGDTTYFADGTAVGPNLWQLVIPQEIVCPAVLPASGCVPYSATLTALRGEWPLTATSSPGPRRFTADFNGPPSAFLLLYAAADPLPFGVPATWLPPLVGLMQPECFWFSPVSQLAMPDPIVVPWQFVGQNLGWVTLDAVGHASMLVSIPDLTVFLGPAGYDDLLFQGAMLLPSAPPPNLGLTNAVRVFVHR